MSLAGDVVAYLGERGLRCALIGAEALAVHGVARATLDSDLLVSSGDVLRESFWSGFSPGAAITVRRGEAGDPLRGVVGVRRRAERTDVIVGPPWTRRILDRTFRITVAGEQLPVVDRAGLVLLKLYAEGPQDLLDVRLLLEAGGEPLRGEVERRLRGLPAGITRTWRKLGTPSS
jgi:hypothetical protein